MMADKPYGEFYDFYSISPEYFGYSLVLRRGHKQFRPGPIIPKIVAINSVTCRTGVPPAPNSLFRNAVLSLLTFVVFGVDTNFG
jgi:hypothetical protein